MKFTDKLRAWRSTVVPMQYIDDCADAADIIDGLAGTLSVVKSSGLLHPCGQTYRAVTDALAKLESLSK